MRRKDIARKAIREAVRSQTFVSARLEGRGAPGGFKLALEAQRFLDSVLAIKRSRVSPQTMAKHR